MLVEIDASKIGWALLSTSQELLAPFAAASQHSGIGSACEKDTANSHFGKFQATDVAEASVAFVGTDAAILAVRGSDVAGFLLTVG